MPGESDQKTFAVQPGDPVFEKRLENLRVLCAKREGKVMRQLEKDVGRPKFTRGRDGVDKTFPFRPPFTEEEMVAKLIKVRGMVVKIREAYEPTSSERAAAKSMMWEWGSFESHGGAGGGGMGM